MDIATLLGSYAFPIVACIAMAFYIKYITDKNSEDTKNLNEQHTTVMLAYKDELKEAISNNTLVMQKLCDKMDIEIKEVRTDEIK